MTTPNQTLLGYLWPVQSTAMVWIRSLVMMVAGSLLVAGAAQIFVPMYPVPMTLQTLAVLLVGGAFGARLGAATLALYALEGAAGLPVFTPLADGYPGIMGPTGGYIIGFIFAAWLVGYLVEKGWGHNVFMALLAMVLGAVLLYIPGLAWLYAFIGSLPATLSAGLFPFILGDVIKLAIAAMALPATWLLVDRP